MILGMSTSTFTLLHVLLSLAGIGSGFIVVFGLLSRRRLDGWTATFLTTTILTSITGFLFPISRITPGIILGILSLLVLTPTLFARYVYHLHRGWRSTYVISAMIALYFNCFVAIVQAFEKIPALNAIAPTQKEPPFAIAQLALLVLFLVLGALAVKKFHINEPVAARARA